MTETETVLLSCTITVGIAVYNVKDYLDDCIESVLAQPCSSMEIILVDDGSTDGSGALCQQYAQRDSRIRLIQFERNRGICEVRNTIIRQATGKWLYFVDGDDVLPPYFSEVALSAADRMEDILVYQFVSFGEKAQFTQPALPLAIDGSFGRYGKDLSRYSIGMHLPAALEQKKQTDWKNIELTSIWAKAYRRGYLLEHRILFPDNQKKSQDMVFNASAYYYCRTMAMIPVQMYGYRVNQQSICKRYNPEIVQIIQAWFQNTLLLAERYYPGDRELVENFYQYSVALGIFNCIRLDFFHPDNPKPFRQRKQEFRQLMAKEPFGTSICKVDIGAYPLEQQFELYRIKRGNARLLDFSYRHPWVFRLYGGTRNRFNKLKRKLGRRPARG